MTDIDKTLAERGERYGSFDGHAQITQDLKHIMHGTFNWNHRLTNSQREALDMIVHKIGRILNGDPHYIDSWHDITGYGKLVEDELVLAEQSIKHIDSLEHA